MEEVSPERPPTPGTPDLTAEADERISLHDIERIKEKDDSDSSGSSTASFVYQDHCYSLPPKQGPPESKASPPRTDDHKAQLADKVVRVKNKLKNVEVRKPKVGLFSILLCAVSLHARLFLYSNNR